MFQLYASEEILYRQQLMYGGEAGSGGVGFGEQGGSGIGRKQRTPAGRLLDDILSADEEEWAGLLGKLSTPGREVSGGVSKEGLLGAVQVRGVWDAFLLVRTSRGRNASNDRWWSHAPVSTWHAASW